MAAEVKLRTPSVSCEWISFSVSEKEQGGILCSIQYKFGAGKMVDTWLCDLPFIYEWVSIYFQTNTLPTVALLLYWLIENMEHSS